MSLKPLPGSHFFSLYFGTEWELFQVIQSEVSQYMEQEGGTIAKYSHILKKSPNSAKATPIETPRVPQPLGVKPKEIKSYWTKPNEQRRERGEFTQQNLKQIPNSKYEIPISRQFLDPNAPSRGWGDGNEIDQIIIANYEPGGNPPDIILGSGSEIEDITSWCQQFKTHIKAGKLRNSLQIPYEKVIGYAAKWCEKEFFESTLKAIFESNKPTDNNPQLSEDIVVDLMYEHFSSSRSLHNQSLAIQKYRHLENETFDRFQRRVGILIGATDFQTMTADQIAIMFHMDMMTNKILKKGNMEEF